MIAITYGYCRDQREDLCAVDGCSRLPRREMCRCSCARGTGTSLDKVTLASAVEALHEQLRTPESDPSFFVADGGIYSAVNMHRFNEANILWIDRVPAHENEAKAVVETTADMTEWQDAADR